MSIDTVVVVGGHMIDAPGRARPRFPPDQIERVTAEVCEALDKWNVGQGSTIVTGGARGADIIAAEEGLTRGADLRLVLALPQREFERESVALPGSDWVARFRKLLRLAKVEVMAGGSRHDVFERTNARIVALARQLDQKPYGLIVWDGREGDGPGGTRDLVLQLRLLEDDERLWVIDPTPIRDGSQRAGHTIGDTDRHSRSTSH